jgi:hypothetical protein
MERITENEIEKFAIEPFERPVYDYIYALSTASDRDNLLLKTRSGKVRVYL